MIFHIADDVFINTNEINWRTVNKKELISTGNVNKFIKFRLSRTSEPSFVLYEEYKEHNCTRELIREISKEEIIKVEELINNLENSKNGNRKNSKNKSKH